MLEVDGITKTYLPPTALLRPLVRVASKHAVAALKSVTLDVAPGEVVGLVGPNGAGKTTLIRIVSTLLEPTAGRVRVGGLDVARHPLQVRSQIGLVLEGDRGIYGRLTGRHNLEFFGTLMGMSPADARARAGVLMESYGLEGRDKLTFGYSAGMRSRLSLARAMLMDPPLLLLDEPTRSLDPVAALQVGKLLRGLAESGRAVLFSSHRLDEIGTICDRVVALVDGEVRFTGTAKDLAGDAGAAATLASWTSAPQT